MKPVTFAEAVGDREYCQQLGGCLLPSGKMVVGVAALEDTIFESRGRCIPGEALARLLGLLEATPARGSPGPNHSQPCEDAHGG